MFDSALMVKSLTIVIKAPMPWGYFGLNDVSLLTAGDESFMLVGGATSISGERCLTASGSELSVETCLDAVASGDGQEVFMFQGNQIVHVASHKCISLISGDANRVVLQDCNVAAKAEDGRSAWELTSNGQLKMPQAGNSCLILVGGNAIVRDCDEAAQAGDSADKYVLAAVPELDLSAAAGVKVGASLLAAAAERQRQALGHLQELFPSLETCRFAAFATNFSRVAKPIALLSAGKGSFTRKLFGKEDAAMAAVERVYTSIGADVVGSLQLISESGSALAAAEAKIARSA